MKKRIWSAIAEGLTSENKTVESCLESAKALTFKYEIDPTRAVLARWNQARHEVIMSIWYHGGL